jgi:4-hydroxybenzoate polyprenyltransferase
LTSFFNRIGEYLKLFRIKHYIKNLLIFIPLFFSVSFYDTLNILACIAGFIAFSLLSSIIYIINDIKDREKDKNHSTKRHRPLAAGTITKRNAVKAAIALFVLLLAVLCFMRSAYEIPYTGISVLVIYFAFNIAYSFGLKNIPLIDLVILASGYILRVLFGALIINVTVSFWLYLVITLGSFYLGLGKRRNEISRQETGTRKVLKLYSFNFLDKNMYVCQTLCIVFYALWSIDDATVQRLQTSAFVFTVPVVFLILLRYSLNIERESDGDPTAIVFQDKPLCILMLLYAVVSCLILYRAGIL